MPDRRDTPDAARVTEDTPATICSPLADLLARPDGPRDRQLLFGDTVTRLGQTDGFAYIRAQKDGYHGFVKADQIGTARAATHRVDAAATHVYDAPDIKSPDRCTLSFGAALHALSETDSFIEIAEGYVPRQHLRRSDDPHSDPIAVAQLFLGTPYLWGGNSRAGIDCSGLVQAALLACNIPCPGDSDQQCRALGPPLPANTPPRTGDLLFWRGHVALYADADTLIHANAHHMRTVLEPAAQAISRIADTATGPAIAHIRL